MQTFVPERDLEENAIVLDYARLNKQITESLQIHRALIYPNYGWQNHPAVQMWRNYECYLVMYTHVLWHDWHHRRGYNNHKSWHMLHKEHTDNGHRCGLKIEEPDWWRGPIHDTHKAKLVWKKYEHYHFYWPDIKVEEDIEPEYYWPSKEKVEA